MFTLTKDGNLCKDGKETKPEMTVRDFMEAFNVPEEAIRVSEDGDVKSYKVKDTFYDIPCEYDFGFCENEIVDIELSISTEPFLEKCDDVSRIQDVQREECLKLIEKDIKYKKKETDGKMTVFYSAKDSDIIFLQEVMQPELSITIEYM